MPARLNWHGPKVREAVLARITRLLTAAALIVKGRAKQLLSKPGTGMVNPRGKVVPHAGGRKKKVYGAYPSRPGQPPAKQTGRLRASVAHEVVGQIARVGTNVKYGRWLELGTVHMQARPWLRRALAESKGQIRALFSRAARF